VAALEQQLLPAIPKRFFYFGAVGFEIGNVALGVTWNAIKIAEFAIGHTHVGGVHVAIYNPGDTAVGYLTSSKIVGHIHEGGEGSMFVEVHALFYREVLHAERTVVEVAQIH
jgi:hypothetical protein